MIKIVHCISDTNFGGAGRVLLNYLAHFNASDFSVTVVLPKGSRLLEYMNSERYTVIEFDGLYDRSYDRGDVKSLKKLFQKLQPDIVHSHGALSARIAAKKCGVKIVYTRHSVFDLPKWQTSFWGKKLLGSINRRYADKIIAVSPAAKTLLTESGTDEQRIVVVFNGVEKIERLPDSMLPAVRQRFQIDENDFVFSIIARLEAVKGHRYLIDAAALLRSQGINCKILIAGTGGMEEQLKEFALQKGVTDMVHFVGFIGNISELLSVTDVQINASYGTEATSMALLEGFSVGIPAIVSDFGGNPYVVSDGNNGLIFKKRSSTALAQAMKKMMSDKEFCRNCGEKAEQIFYEKFTALKMTEQMESIYNELSKGGNQ